MHNRTLPHPPPLPYYSRDYRVKYQKLLPSVFILQLKIANKDFPLYILYTLLPFTFRLFFVALFISQVLLLLFLKLLRLDYYSKEN